MKFEASLTCRFSLPDEQADTSSLMDSHLDAVMEQLIHLGAEDPRIDLDIGNASVEFHVTIATTEPIGALSQASGLLRTAIHAAGGVTENWPRPPHPAWALELVSVRSDPLSDDVGWEDAADLDGEPVPV